MSKDSNDTAKAAQKAALARAYVTFRGSSEEAKVIARQKADDLYEQILEQETSRAKWMLSKVIHESNLLTTREKQAIVKSTAWGRWKELRDLYLGDEARVTALQAAERDARAAEEEASRLAKAERRQKLLAENPLSYVYVDYQQQEDAFVVNGYLAAKAGVYAEDDGSGELYQPVGVDPEQRELVAALIEEALANKGRFEVNPAVGPTIFADRMGLKKLD